jgi:cytidylate kinase
MSNTRVIAIDGYAATGKSTLAKKLASELNYRYMDTGSMFRVLTYQAMTHGFLKEDRLDNTAFEAFLSKSHFYWEGSTLGFNQQVLRNEIRTYKVSTNVSKIAALPYVRKFALKSQRDLAQGHSIVMDGRDIGTVVFPEAKHKFFLDASPEVRAQRRWEEMQQQGSTVSLEAILENIRARDKEDSERAIAPLRKADDALLIDTSNQNIEEVFQTLLSHFV